jgi:serine/threonine protein kinase
MLDPIRTGDTISGYTVDTVLGRGASAVVYRVVDSQGQFYALKLLSLGDDEAARRLLREGKVQHRLEHPNIVRVIEFLEFEGQPALIMEYVEGPSLRRWIHDRIEINYREVDFIAQSLLDAVGFAHSEGVIHRDLKPANILLARDGHDWVPKICDFGLVKLHGEHSDGLTSTGVSMGTPAYMSPEQIIDTKSVDHRSDIFSLASILYELVSDHRAFAAETLTATLARISMGTYKGLDDTIVPSRMIRAIEAGLIVDVDERPQTIDDMFDLWLNDDDPTMTIPKEVESVSEWIERSQEPRSNAWVWFAVAAAGVVGMFGGGLYITVSRGGAQRELPVPVLERPVSDVAQEDIGSQVEDVPEPTRRVGPAPVEAPPTRRIFVHDAPREEGARPGADTAWVKVGPGTTNLWLVGKQTYVAGSRRPGDYLLRVRVDGESDQRDVGMLTLDGGFIYEVNCASLPCRVLRK